MGLKDSEDALAVQRAIVRHRLYALRGDRSPRSHSGFYVCLGVVQMAGLLAEEARILGYSTWRRCGV